MYRLNIWVLDFKKFKFGGAENLGKLGQIGRYLRKYKYLVKEVY